MVGHRNPESMLQCNTYVRSFRQFGSRRNICIDPGSQLDYSVVESNIAELLGDTGQIHAMTINHQDPDVAGNAPDLCDANPQVELITSEEVWRLLQHTMVRPGKLRLSQGATPASTTQPFQFVPTPFCHFRGAMALYDPEQRILYSGDLFGGLNRLGDVHLWATEEDWNGIAQFHQIYMPSREVLRYAVKQILRLRPKVEIIAPQHGHVIKGEMVDLFLERMHELLVGHDLFSDAWDHENLEGYQEVIQRLINEAESQRGDVNVTCRLSEDEASDDLHSQLQFRQRQVHLEREGYTALAKVFARLADGETKEFISDLRKVVAEGCHDLGLPIPPAASGFEAAAEQEGAS
jgi:flavorubredoxin